MHSLSQATPDRRNPGRALWRMVVVSLLAFVMIAASSGAADALDTGAASASASTLKIHVPDHISAQVNTKPQDWAGCFVAIAEYYAASKSPAVMMKSGALAKCAFYMGGEVQLGKFLGCIDGSAQQIAKALIGVGVSPASIVSALGDCAAVIPALGPGWAQQYAKELALGAQYLSCAGGVLKIAETAPAGLTGVGLILPAAMAIKAGYDCAGAISLTVDYLNNYDVFQNVNIPNHRDCPTYETTQANPGRYSFTFIKGDGTTYVKRLRLTSGRQCLYPVPCSEGVDVPKYLDSFVNQADFNRAFFVNYRQIQRRDGQMLVSVYDRSTGCMYLANPNQQKFCSVRRPRAAQLEASIEETEAAADDLAIVALPKAINEPVESMREDSASDPLETQLLALGLDEGDECDFSESDWNRFRDSKTDAELKKYLKDEFGIDVDQGNFADGDYDTFVDNYDAEGIDYFDPTIDPFDFAMMGDLALAGVESDDFQFVDIGEDWFADYGYEVFDDQQTDADLGVLEDFWFDVTDVDADIRLSEKAAVELVDNTEQINNWDEGWEWEIAEPVFDDLLHSRDASIRADGREWLTEYKGDLLNVTSAEEQYWFPFFVQDIVYDDFNGGFARNGFEEQFAYSWFCFDDNWFDLLAYFGYPPNTPCTRANVDLLLFLDQL